MKFLLTKNTLLIVILIVFMPIIADPQEQVTVNTIRVWIAVEGANKPLTQADFEIYEDGKKMSPTCFEPIPLSQSIENEPAEESSEQNQPTASPIRIAIFFDQLNTSEAELRFIRPKIDEMLDQVRGKSDVMLAGVPPYEALVTFTKDVNEIRAKLDGLSGNKLRDIEMQNRRRDIQMIMESGRQDRVAMAYKRALLYQQDEMQRTQLVFEALHEFGQYLNTQQQTDHTVGILISGGLNSNPGHQYFDMINQADPDDFSSLGGSGLSHFDTKKNVQKTIGSLNRDNLTLYTINTRGQLDVVDDVQERRGVDWKRQRQYSEEYMEVLDRIAEETGGISFHNSLNFKHGFDAILNDLSRQYLLCYVAPEHKSEGQYHQIKVSSKVSGVKLRHRAGYVD